MKNKNQSEKLVFIGYPGKGVKLSNKIIDFSNCVIIDPENEIQIKKVFNNCVDKKCEFQTDSCKK